MTVTTDAGTAFPTGAVPDRADFALRLDGADAPPELVLDVLEIDVTEEVNRHGRAVLLVRDWDAATGQVRHSDAGTFAPGVAVELSLGWRDQLTPVFAGVVTAVTARFGGSGAPTLEVTCRTRGVLLAAAPRARAYENANDGDVAADLAGRYGLTALADDGIDRPQVVFHGCTDWDWLVDRAGRLGWVTYVRGTDLIFRPPAGPTGQELVLAYGSTLRELRLRQELGDRAEPVTVRGWDPARLEPVDADAGSARAEPTSDGRPTPADALGAAGWPLRERLVATSAEISAAEADRLAVAAASGEVLAQLSGTGVTIGLPQLAADSWVRVDGIGDRLGGLHYVSAVRHRLGRRGFSTEFQLGRPARLAPPGGGAPGGSAGPGAPAGSAGPGYHGTGGLLLGVVRDLDDPLKWGRVKVAFPWLDPAPDPVWARLVTLDAGPGQGSWFVPDVGQEVLVGRVDDDPGCPVVLGALWNGTQAPPESMDPGTNAIRSVVSRSGHRLTFDDHEPGRVAITTAGGYELVLDDDGRTVSLTGHGGDNTVTLSTDGIEVTARTGDIVLSAPSGEVKIDAARLSAKASGPATVESSASLELKAAGSLAVTGAQVRIN